MAQLPFVVLSCFCFHQGDLLHPRVIIASYNPHVGSFLPSLGLVSAPSLLGARSRHCYEIMLNFGQERSRKNAALAVEPCCAPILLVETGHGGQVGIPKRSLIVGALYRSFRFIQPPRSGGPC